MCTASVHYFSVFPEMCNDIEALYSKLHLQLRFLKSTAKWMTDYMVHYIVNEWVIQTRQDISNPPYTVSLHFNCGCVLLLEICHMKCYSKPTSLKCKRVIKPSNTEFALMQAYCANHTHEGATVLCPL